MTKRSMALLMVLVVLVFVTCTGCTGVVLAPDGTVVGYAIGDASLNLAKTPAEQACDYTGDYVPTRGRAWIGGEYVETTGRVRPAKLGQPAYCESNGPGLLLSLKGGNLGPGWFGVMSTAIMAWLGVPGL